MLSGGRPAAAKKDWMNTHMTFDSRAPHRSLSLPLIAHENVLFMDFMAPWTFWVYVCSIQKEQTQHKPIRYHVIYQVYALGWAACGRKKGLHEHMYDV